MDAEVFKYDVEVKNVDAEVFYVDVEVKNMDTEGIRGENGGKRAKFGLFSYK